jgi:hypothetical protein
MFNVDNTSLTGRTYLGGWGDWPDMKSSLIQRVFGHMLRLAGPVVKEFQSDLYHDALALEGILDRGMNAIETATSFHFAVRHHGTWTESMAITAATGNHGDLTRRLYQITVERDDRKAWWIEVEDVTDTIADTLADLKR